MNSLQAAGIEVLEYQELYSVCLNDISTLSFKLPVKTQAVIAKKAVNSFVRTPFTSIRDDLFLKELLDSLAMSGIANEIAGSSAPTSGSEHLISHALNKMLEAPQLHGIQVGIATYLMSLVQEHRSKRVHTIFTDTGFFNYVETLNWISMPMSRQLSGHLPSSHSAIPICMRKNTG